MNKLACLMASLFLLLWPLQATALSPSSDTLYDGIDVSHWQGDIDFEQVAAGGISIVYIKSSEGTALIDPNFQINYEKAAAHGLQVGFYHYLTATTTEEAVLEAQFFASLIEGKGYTCLPAMDYESFGDSLDAASIDKIAQAFITAVKTATDHDVLVYSNASNVSSIFSDTLSASPLWIADHSGSLPETAGGLRHWAGYQYSGAGTVSGISTNVDLNKFTSDILLSNTIVSGGDTSTDSFGSEGDGGPASAGTGSGTDDSGSATGDGPTTGSLDTSPTSDSDPQLSLAAAAAGFTAVLTIASGGGGISLGLRISKRSNNSASTAGEEETEDMDPLKSESRQHGLDEIKQIEELELIELKKLHEERRYRLQEQRRLREEQELEELRALQKKAQELQEELWALKEKAMQDPTATN